MNQNLNNLRKDLHREANKEKAVFHQRFFKTGKGHYGEGDVFLGITVPVQRKIAKKYGDLELPEVQELLDSPIHEHRFTALEILVFKYEKAMEKDKERIVKFYIKNRNHINNWDLVDTSAKDILGHYLFDKEKDVLYKLAQSKSIWDKRIAIVSTHYFIKKGRFEDTLKIAKLLMGDTHDLIHKAVGWMLREVGNISPVIEEAFLKKHYKSMPRTMLRYAIEKFPREVRHRYLKGTL